MIAEVFIRVKLWFMDLFLCITALHLEGIKNAELVKQLEVQKSMFTYHITRGYSTYLVFLDQELVPKRCNLLVLVVRGRRSLKKP